MKRHYLLPFIAVLFMITAAETQAQLIGCFEPETAWATCTYGETGQNWQVYVKTDANPEYEIISGGAVLLGGKMLMGYISFYQEYVGGPVTLTFDIYDGWMMDLREIENVKIDTYSSGELPKKFIPGKFAFKSYQTDNNFIIDGLPSAKYYAIHLDVLRQVPCE